MQSWSSLLFAFIQIKNTLDKNTLDVKLVSFVSELRHQFRKTNTSETQEKNNLDKLKSATSRIYLSEMSKVTIKKKLQNIFRP